MAFVKVIGKKLKKKVSRLHSIRLLVCGIFTKYLDGIRVERQVDGLRIDRL